MNHPMIAPGYGGVSKNPGFIKFLEKLQDFYNLSNPEYYCLWPKTPIDDKKIQDKIKKRMDGKDDISSGAGSRPDTILRCLQRLKGQEKIDRGFSVLDIACGDAQILGHIKQNWSQSLCYGLDPNAGKFNNHKGMMKKGIRIYPGYLQTLIKMKNPGFDVMLMLNTYRDFKRAQLREQEKDLPDKLNEWFKEYSKFVILTAMPKQIEVLQDLGFIVNVIGKGEDASKMVLLENS